MRGYGYTYVDKKGCLEMTFARRYLALPQFTSWKTGRETYCKLIDKKKRKEVFDEKRKRKTPAHPKKIFCFHAYYSSHAAIHYKPLP